MDRVVRPPAVAGTFYPASPDRPETDVRAYLDQAMPVDLDFIPRMAIVPHAGYVYSGPVAATAYRLIRDLTAYRRIVMLGPSHFVWVSGLALPGADRLATPLGEVAVDSTGVATALGSLVVDSTDAHRREHSLEVQLPFLQVIAPDATVIPLLTGDVDPHDVADLVLPLLDEATLLLISSDLSHYYDYGSAQALDAVSVAAIERRDPGALGRESACGRTGIQAALIVARHLGYRVQAIDVRNSGDTAGPRDQVVGYGAFAAGS